MAKNLLNTVPDGALKNYLPPFFESYPNLKGMSPASFIVWSDNPPPSAEPFFERACHADLKYLAPGYDHLITAVPHTDELSLAYLQMLILGPFKGFSDLISLNKMNNNYYLLCADLGKWPANVLYNFCIASRVPIEYAKYLPYWHELVTKGFEPTLAFLLSYSTGGKGLTPRAYPPSNHMWLDPASDWRSIIAGEPKNMTPAFKEYPKGCSPCNTIWGHSHDYRKFATMTAEEVSAYLELPIEVSVAPKPKAKPKTKNEVIAQAVAGAAVNAGDINAFLAGQAVAQAAWIDNHPPQLAPAPIEWGQVQQILNPVEANNLLDEVNVNFDDDDDDDDGEWDAFEPEFNEDDDD